MRRICFVLCLTISLAALVLDPSPAQAERILVLTYGETISHIADVPAKVRKGKFKRELGEVLDRIDKLLAPAVGFRYSSFGICYLDLWTWDGRYCLYTGRTAWDMPLPEVAKMLDKSEEELSKPWYYTYPPGLLILGGIVAIAVLVRALRKSPQTRARELLEDLRYQKALEIWHQERKKEAAAAAANALTENEARIAALVPAEAPNKASDKPFACALAYLLGEGISAKDAEKNLTVILANQSLQAGL
jgi:hypothetical protein